ncbi:MAG TPA: hypothetical protein VF827_03785, partial [Syntrophales bacterium]
MPIPQIEIVPVGNGKELHRFVTLPWKVYRGDANWVPPLIGDMKSMLRPEKHPFYRHGEVALFMALRRGEPVGRIAAIINHRHNEFQEEKTGFFGFFETVNDPYVSGALLERAADWARERGMDRLRGPASFSTNEECAMLISGFDSPPCVMMPYNPPYYPTLMEGAGFTKAKDLVAYNLTREEASEDRLRRLAEVIAQREQVSIRPIDRKRFGEEVANFSVVYNQAWEKNWGFVPMTDEEIEHMAKSLKSVIEPDLVLFMQKNGSTIGFAMALPDLNRALKHANGRLFPFGLVKILWYARRIHKVRVLVLGLLKEYRGRGLDILLYLHLYRNGLRKGYTEGEFS